MLYFSQKIFAILIRPWGRHAALLAAVLLLAAVPAPCADGDRDGALERLKGTYEETRRKMTEEEAEVHSLAGREARTLENLNETALAMDQTRKKIRASEKALQALENEISTVLDRIESLRGSIQATQAYAEQRMVSLYKLDSLGRMNVIASAGSLSDFLRRRKALSRILAADRQVLQDYRLQRESLAELRADLERRRQQQATAASAHRRHLEELNAQQRRRKVLLTAVRDQKAAREAALASLAEQAAALDRKIQAFQREAPPGASPEGFARLKGLLNLPVEGTIVNTFGPYRNEEFGVVNFRSGIDIQAERGEPIRSVYSGRVIFSSWFKGYGNMVIIDHGEHYYTLYAHADELFKQKGETVAADEVLGTVGDTGPLGVSGLHFEVRHHGKPVDPMTWLKKG